VAGAPSHHLRKAKGNCNGKSGRPKGTVKSRMAKNGNGNLKKKKQDIDVPMSCFFLRNFPGCTRHSKDILKLFLTVISCLPKYKANCNKIYNIKINSKF
jgi:hypothetical protein